MEQNCRIFLSWFPVPPAHNDAVATPLTHSESSSQFSFLELNDDDSSASQITDRAEENRNKLNSEKLVKVDRILHGTLDPEEGSDTIFYDAQETGDGESENEFNAEYEKNSVVLRGIDCRRNKTIAAILDGFNAAEDCKNGDHDADFSESAATSMASPTSFCEHPSPPIPPSDLPLRFLRAAKGDPEAGILRYEETLVWRKEHKIDYILREPNFHFALIKSKYPHFNHLRGHNNEPCFYEKPPKTDLEALRKGGVTLDSLLRHYAMVTEFQWQFLTRDDLARSIYIIDLDGMRLGDFVGEPVDFVRKASEFSNRHYPERCGVVFVINVPIWFSVIWKVVSKFADEVTLKKIFILRDKEEIRQRMEEKIPIENIPPEYGGQSMPLGESPEEKLFADLVEHNNALSRGECYSGTNFSSWDLARSY